MKIKKRVNCKYFDRELSWLSFNARVLQEAEDMLNSVYDRIKFLGIYSNNKDEFFRVRVAALNRLVELHKKNYTDSENVFQQILDQVLEEVGVQQGRFVEIYNSINLELCEQGICIINEQQLDKNQGEFVREYFNEEVRPHLFPIMLSNYKKASMLADSSIYLAVILERADKPEKNSFAIIEIPTNVVNRFLVLPKNKGKQYVILLDDVIRYCLDEIFTQLKFDVFKAYTFKFTRDAELDIDNDISKSFLELMAEGIAQRKTGSALRFVFDKDMPENLLTAVTEKLNITVKDKIVNGGRYHNFKDYMAFPNMSETKKNVLKQPTLLHKDLKNGESIIKAVRKKDIMFHYPYQSFQHIVDMLREVSIDPKVKSIKMTIYRLANPSNVINALVNAARNGKHVVVFMELQARFDEEANIFWSEKLQDAGVKVLHGIPGLKVHSKVILIKRKEKRGFRYYANISTGNFHEKTGKLYADDALLTCNPQITNDVNKLFSLFEVSYRSARFRTLIVSPFSTRNFFIRLINTEITNAKLKRKSGIIIKLNSLSDIKLINKLYDASNAGVSIKIIVRGICKLVPGVKGVSENIEVRSILDKYLEHSRVFIFHNNGEERYFISSADWMVRNLDNRIEVTTPILDKEIQRELKEIIDIQLRDNTKAREIDENMSNNYIQEGEGKVRAQIDIYNFLKKTHSKSK